MEVEVKLKREREIRGDTSVLNKRGLVAYRITVLLRPVPAARLVIPTSGHTVPIRIQARKTIQAHSTGTLSFTGHVSLHL